MTNLMSLDSEKSYPSEGSRNSGEQRKTLKKLMRLREKEVWVGLRRGLDCFGADDGGSKGKS